MARTALTPVTALNIGTVFTLSAANVDGHSIVNQGGTILIVYNGSGSPINVTIQTPGKVRGVDIAEVVVQVLATSYKVIGVFETEVFNQADGTVYVDFSAVTTVTCAAIKTH